MPKKSLFFEVTPKSWNDAKSIGTRLKGCIFRGHAEKCWRLKTSIERAAEQFRCPPEAIWEKERQIFYRFKSRAFQFIQSPPNDNDFIEWLGLIQHYGGPTRLLDFTDSFYLASYFAMESGGEKDACVWAINDNLILSKISQKVEIKMDKDKYYPAYLDGVRHFAESFIESPNQKQDLVLRVTPSRLNERLAVQKGVFLFPCNVEKSFEKNLCSTFDFQFDALDSDNSVKLESQDINNDIIRIMRVMKINLPREWHCDAFIDLFSMNIDAASLFPGLDGFAKSLKLGLRVMEKPYWDKINKASNSNS